MIAVILLGSYGGIKLDERFPNKYSLYTIFGSLFAVALSTYLVIKQVKDDSKKEDRNP